MEPVSQEYFTFEESGTARTKEQESEIPARRSAPFDDEPGYHSPSGLWLYGNVRILRGPLAHVSLACSQFEHAPRELAEIETEAEQYVLDAKVLVCGVHNSGHQRAALVPLRWGAPRVVVVSGGFRHHLGEDLKDEPFRAARLWRYQWDARSDLMISRRAPDKKPTLALHNPTVDRLIRLIAKQECQGLQLPVDRLTPALV